MKLIPVLCLLLCGCTPAKTPTMEERLDRLGTKFDQLNAQVEQADEDLNNLYYENLMMKQILAKFDVRVDVVKSNGVRPYIVITHPELAKPLMAEIPPRK